MAQGLHAPALGLNTIIFKYVYWYMKQISGERLQDHWSSGFSVRWLGETEGGCKMIGQYFWWKVNICESSLVEGLSPVVNFASASLMLSNLIRKQ